jgi:hypothetical protein
MNQQAQVQILQPNDLKFIKPSNIEFREFTKEQAKLLIKGFEESGKRNREPSPQTVDKYLNDMDSGKWDETICNNQILIDKDGTLRGGLHRMTAFIKATTRDKIIFPVEFNASEETIKRQDTGKIDNNNMAMPDTLNRKIADFEFLSKRAIHTASSLLVFADNHPGFDNKGKVKMKDKKDKSYGGKAFNTTADDVVLSINKYLPILEEMDTHAFPLGRVNKENNYAGFAPFVAAVAKAYTLMDKKLWKNFASLLTVQDISHLDQNDTNRRLAAQELINVFLNKSEQNNPIKVDRDMRLALSCLAAAHNNEDINTVDMETYGYETFLK